MDIKSNINNAIDHGGFVDIKRIQKVNSQLEYQPNLARFIGGSSNNDQNNYDIQEQEENHELLQKQRDIDSKSDRIVSSSIQLFKLHTSNPDLVNNKVKEVRLKNSIQRERQRFQPDSMDQYHFGDNEMKTKIFKFPPRDYKHGKTSFLNENNELNKEGNVDDDDTQEKIQQLLMQKRKSQTESSAKELASAAANSGAKGGGAALLDKGKFDFEQIKQKQLISKAENLTKKQIGNLPKEIQQISEIQEEIIESTTDRQEYSEQEEFDRSKVDFMNGDLIESFSIAIPSKETMSSQKSAHNFAFYRDLAPISRYLMKFTNSNQERKKVKYNDDTSCLDLIQSDEITFDIHNLTYFNIQNIISGRIGDDTLKRLDNSSNLDQLPPKIEFQVKELLKQQIEQYQTQHEKVQAISAPPPLQVTESDIAKQRRDEARKSQSSKESLRLGFRQKQNVDQPTQIEPSALNLNSGNNFSIKKDVLDMSPEQRKIHSQVLTIHSQTDKIIQKIQEIRNEKENLEQIKDLREFQQFEQSIKKSMQSSLNDLLYIILKTDMNPNPIINSNPKELDHQVAQLLGNLEHLQGMNTSDGHLKSVLLLTFLEEYKWVRQEQHLQNMDFEQASNSDNKNKKNNNNSKQQNGTFPNYYHSGSNSFKTPQKSGKPGSSQQQPSLSKNSNSKSSQSLRSNAVSRPTSRADRGDFPTNLQQQQQDYSMKENQHSHHRRSQQPQRDTSNKHVSNTHQTSQTQSSLEFIPQDSFSPSPPKKHNQKSFQYPSNQGTLQVTPDRRINQRQISRNNSSIITSHNQSVSNNNNNNGGVSPHSNSRMSDMQSQTKSSRISPSPSMKRLPRQNSSMKGKSKQSNSVIASKNGMFIDEIVRNDMLDEEYNQERNPFEKQYIPGIKRGINSAINQQYLNERSISRNLTSRTPLSRSPVPSWR